MEISFIYGPIILGYYRFLSPLDTAAFNLCECYAEPLSVSLPGIINYSQSLAQLDRTTLKYWPC
jgi:hypothetical protein